VVENRSQAIKSAAISTRSRR